MYLRKLCIFNWHSNIINNNNKIVSAVVGININFLAYISKCVTNIWFKNVNSAVYVLDSCAEFVWYSGQNLTLIL